MGRSCRSRGSSILREENSGRYLSVGVRFDEGEGCAVDGVKSDAESTVKRAIRAVASVGSNLTPAVRIRDTYVPLSGDCNWGAPPGA